MSMNEENENYEYIEEYIESAGVTFDRDYWNEIVTQELSEYFKEFGEILKHHVEFVPEGVVDYLAAVFEGYMIGPTAVYKNQTLTAKTRMVEEIKEFKDHILELDKPVFLYTVTYVPSHPVFETVDDKFKPVKLDHPVIKGGYWKVRYAVLGE